MAIYHLSAKPLSRMRRNTVRAVAYRTGCYLQDFHTGESFNYRNKLVQQVDLLLPEKAPSWVQDLSEQIVEDRESGIQAFCDLVEGAEKRCDARIYREIEFALPRELDDVQGIQLAQDFIKRHINSQGIGVLACFHLECDSETGERKPHCHALLLTRRLTESGLALSKDRSWNHVSFLTHVRTAWAEEVNAALKFYDYEARIDHRSYAKQGLTIEPQPKLGRNVSEFAKRIARRRESLETPFSPPITVERKVLFEPTRLRNLYRILSRPELVFEITSRHQATFMWGDVQRVLARYIDDGALFQKMEGRLRSSRDLVLLRLEEKGGEDQAVYTTKALLKAERRIITTVAHLMADTPLASIMDEEALKQQQEVFVRHLTSSGRLKCGTGFAGTGKTRALSVCRDYFESQGRRIYGLAPTGKAAKNLEQSGIMSMTLDRFLHQLQQNRHQYNASSVLILDEAGMVDVRRFDRLLEAVQRLGVKLLCIGDEGQLKPVEAGAAFLFLRERAGEATLSHIQRQKIDWQKTATQYFGELRTEEALRLYLKKGCVHFVSGEAGGGRAATRQELIQHWGNTLGQDNVSAPLILAHTRSDVASLNHDARLVLKERGLVAQEEFIFTIKKAASSDWGERSFVQEEKAFSVGDRIVFTQNNTGLGVKNGGFGIITKVNSQKMNVVLEGGASIAFSPKLFPWIDHGWALTVHKSQGTTVDKTFVLASAGFSRNLSYVALSRHRESVEVFASLEEFPHPRFFIQKLSRMQEKLGSADYLTAEQLQETVAQDEALLKRVFRPLGDKLQAAGYVSKHAVLDLADAFLGRERAFFSAPLSRCLSEERRAEALFAGSHQEKASILEDPIFATKSPQWKAVFERKLQNDPQGGMRLLNQEKELRLKMKEEKRIQEFVRDYTLKEKHLEDLRFLSQTPELQDKRLVLEKELQALACSGMRDETLIAHLESLRPDFVARLEAVILHVQEEQKKVSPTREHSQMHAKGPVLEI